MSEVKNVPELRFHGFSNNWEVVSFGKIYSFSPTNSLSRASLNNEMGIFKNIHYGDIHTKYPTMLDAQNTPIPFITDARELSKSHSESICKIGDLVFADASEDYTDVGKAVQITSIPNEPLLCGLHTFLAKDKSLKTAIGFSGYLMSSYKVRKQIMTMAVGAKVLGISKTNLAKVSLDIPSKDEQQKIADFLSSVDKKIEQLTEKHRLLTEYKKGTMQQIFSQQIRFKDDNGNDYPEWEDFKFGDAFSRVTRKNKENNLNVMTISAQQGLINQEKYFNKSVSASDVTGYYLLQKGEFAYNKSYSAGYPMGAIKRLNRYEAGVVSTLYICFKANQGIEPLFVEQYFEAGMLNHEIKKIAQEGARNHGLLNISVVEFFKDINLELPSLEEQQIIASFLTEIDQKIDQAWSTLEQTKAFKKGLLQKMFV